MELQFGVSKDDQSVTESFALGYCALARAYCIMNDENKAIVACKCSLGFASTSKEALAKGNSYSRKQGWKASKKDNRRAESNSIYRNHRLREIEYEVQTLMKIIAKAEPVEQKVHERGLMRRLVTRLVLLSGGGTTDLQNGKDHSYMTTDRATDNTNSSKALQKNLINSLFFSFGLSVVAQNFGVIIDKEIAILRKKDCNRILGSCGLQSGILMDNGLLDLHRIFSAGIGCSKKLNKQNRMKKSTKVELELGAGFGDWIVRKAIQSQSTKFVAVELRSDRVAQIFTKAAVLSHVDPIDNLCIVGGDSCTLLSKHISNNSVDTIYVNFPEPPTQTYGTEDATLASIAKGTADEPAHMLNSRVIVEAMKCLKKDARSKLVIVTDNLWEGKLICATVERINHQTQGIVNTVDLTKLDKANNCQIYKKVKGTTGSVIMFEGIPNETIGHPSGGMSSYFDRLWSSGAGKHSETKLRYIIVLSPMNHE